MGRYDNTDRTWVPHKTRGWVQVTHRWPQVWDNQLYSEQVSTDFDTFPQLAIDNFNDPNLYYGIAEMNPEVLCPDDLSPGVVLQIPAGPR